MLRILVIDPEPLVQRAVRRALDRKGYMVVTASNAKAALDAIEHYKIDIIMTEFNLDDMDGRQLRSKVIASHPEIAFIFCTSLTGGEDAEHFLKEHHTLIKPFGLDDVESILEAVA